MRGRWWGEDNEKKMRGRWWEEDDERKMIWWEEDDERKMTRGRWWCGCWGGGEGGGGRGGGGIDVEEEHEPQDREAHVLRVLAIGHRKLFGSARNPVPKTPVTAAALPRKRHAGKDCLRETMSCGQESAGPDQSFVSLRDNLQSTLIHLRVQIFERVWAVDMPMNIVLVSHVRGRRAEVSCGKTFISRQLFSLLRYRWMDSQSFAVACGSQATAHKEDLCQRLQQQCQPHTLCFVCSLPIDLRNRSDHQSISSRLKTQTSNQDLPKPAPNTAVQVLGRY